MPRHYVSNFAEVASTNDQHSTSLTTGRDYTDMIFFWKCLCGINDVEC